MSENKFLAKMRGEKAPKSLVEVKNDKFSTPFVDLPKSTSVTDGFDNEAEHSIVVAKSAQNWALQKSGIELLADAESADYTGQVSIAGHGMWVNSSYTFPLSAEPANPVVAIINPCAKWVLNFVGKDLFSQNDTIGFTLVVKVGATHISNIDCEVKRQAGFFCKKFVIDFSESEQELIKVNGGDTLTVQLVCNDETASAVYYTGSSVLSLLQRKVDGDVVAGNTKTFGDLVEDVYDIREEIKNKFLGVYRFKGTVPTYMDLPADNNVVGDTYNIGDTGSNYTWDGTAWDKLSETVDLSPYLTKAEAEATYLPKATVLDYDNITNCLTEIPQDIKLEFADGVLTLKAGSKVYVPNGAGVFDVVNIANDISNSGNAAKSFAITNGSILVWTNYVSSGGTAPENPYNGQIWYDTTNNVVKRYSTSVGTWVGGFSLPVALLNLNATTSTTVTEMQVFNGFGYIGSTVFVLPGVKGLIPNGRNEDGTLKNILLTVNSVKTNNYTGTNNNLWWGFAPNVYFQTGSLVQYDSINNTINWKVSIFAKSTVENGRITSFEPKPAFRAVDYNDFETLSDTVATNNDNAVHKTGNETIDGTKHFTGDIKYGSLTKNGSYKDIEFRDTNGIRLGALRGQWTENGNRRVEIFTVTADGNRGSGIGVYMTADGKEYHTAKTPDATSDTNHIATTAWSNAKFLPLAGGTMSGNLTFSGTGIRQANNSSLFSILGSTSSWNAPLLAFYGYENTTSPGSFLLRAGDGTNNKDLIGKPDGTLLWDGKGIVRTTSHSKAQNGYYKFTNGLIIQWGRIEAEAAYTSGSVTFPTAFTSSNVAVQIEIMSAGNAKMVRPTNFTTTGFAYVSDTFGSPNPTAQKTWIAIGY